MFKKIKIIFHPSNRKFILTKLNFWFRFLMFIKHRIVFVLKEDFFSSKIRCKIKVRHRFEPAFSKIKNRIFLEGEMQDSKSVEESEENEFSSNAMKFKEIPNFGETGKQNKNPLENPDSEIIENDDIEITEKIEQMKESFNLDDIDIDLDADSEVIELDDIELEDQETNCNLKVQKLELNLIPRYKRPRNCSTQAN